MLGTSPLLASRAAAATPRSQLAISARTGGLVRALELTLLGFLLAAGFFARVWQLGAKSFWLDEGISVEFATGDLATILNTLVERDLHPPTYYLLLAGWMEVAGRTETAIRFPSVLVSVLLVALLYQFARTTFPGWSGRATGMVAAALAAFSPFLIHHAQEARMYGMLAVAGLAATLALQNALEARRSSWRAWVLYVLCAALAPYVHHFGWFVLAFHGVYVALSAGRLRRRALAWIGAAGLVIALYLPWAYAALRQVTRLREIPDFWLGTLSLWFVVQQTFAGFTLGSSGAFEQSPLLLLLFGAVAGMGLLFLVWRALLAQRRGELLVACYLIVPLLMLYAVVANNPKFVDRYLIVILPAFLLLLARGSVGLAEAALAARRRPALGLALAVGSALLAVGVLAASVRESTRVYAGDSYAKDDYRSAVSYLIGRWQPGDAVVLLPDTRPVFDYYAKGMLARYPLQPHDNVPFAADQLNEFVGGGHDRLWVLMWNQEWADPTGGVRALLDEQAELVPIDFSPRGLSLKLYSVQGEAPFSAGTRPTVELDARFGDAVRLHGYDLPAEPIQAGEGGRLSLYWEALRPMSEDIGVALRLMRGGHEWWRFDGRPAAHTYPTMYWKTGRIVRGRVDLAVPSGTPPGQYDLQLVVYDAAARRDLPLSRPGGARGETVLPIGTIEVARPRAATDPTSLPIPAVAPIELSGLELRGVWLDPSRVRAGGTIRNALAWRLTGEPRERVVDVWLVDAGDHPWHLSSGAPVDGTYPVSRWTAHELVVDRRTLAVPPAAVSGAARLLVGVRAPDAVADPDSAHPIGEIEVAPRALPAAVATPGRLIDARFGDVAQLIGVDLPPAARRGEALRVVLYWRALTTPSASYSVFVHVMGADERPLAQSDGVPAGGSAQTTSWLAGDVIADEYSVAIGPDIPSGAYRVAVGMYDPRDGQRLPAVRGGELEPDGRLLIGDVQID